MAVLLAVSYAGPLDDYVAKVSLVRSKLTRLKFTSTVSLHCCCSPPPRALPQPESVYKWRDTGLTIDGLYFGGKAYILNVTSLTWLDTSKAYIPRLPVESGNVWSHQVMVVVPKELKFTNVSTMVLNGGCIGDKYPDKKDEYLELAARIAQALQHAPEKKNSKLTLPLSVGDGPDRRSGEPDPRLPHHLPL